MGLIEFILVCVVLGVALTLVRPYMDAGIYRLIVIVAILLLVIVLIRALGVDLSFPRLRA